MLRLRDSLDCLVQASWSVLAQSWRMWANRSTARERHSKHGMHGSAAIVTQLTVEHESWRRYNAVNTQACHIVAHFHNPEVWTVRDSVCCCDFLQLSVAEFAQISIATHLSHMSHCNIMVVAILLGDRKHMGPRCLFEKHEFLCL